MKRTLAFVCFIVMLFMSAAIADVAPEKVFDLSVVDGKLGIWFLSLTGEDHTGESILIRTPNGCTVLVDGGIPEVGMQVNEVLDRLNIEKIDVMLGTHMHIDHIGGLASVIAQHEVGILYVSPLKDYQTNAVASFKSAASAKQLPLTVAVAGDQFTLDGVSFTFLSPVDQYADMMQKQMTGRVLNDSSLVFMMTYGEIKVLFCGDMTRMAEWDLIERYGDELKADLIKIGHHGSVDASSREFVQTVAAQNSVMCIYAFNDFSIYDRYKKVGNRPYVTSIDGCVLYVTDGEQESFYTEKERKGALK